MSRSLIVPLAFLLVLPLVDGRAQAAPVQTARVQPEHAQLTPRDSLRALDEARSAQSSFESARRQNLPRLQPSAAQPCDASVGRMCYWNEDDDVTEHEPSAITEGTPILRARRRLLAVLGRLSALAPGDTWIVGQRVRYLVESGADSAAMQAARECRSQRWWCQVLDGYALHSAGDYAASEAVFDSALAAMPQDVRCRWNDIALLLEDGERENYQKLPCGSRRQVEQRFWKLAQPSYAVHGNDRRTEHFSRVLLAELWSSSANAYGMAWGDDMREILIRYGAPLWYAGTWSTTMGSSTATVGHDRKHSYHFAATVDGDRTHWDTHSRNARERYAPPYMDSLAELNAQFAMLKRGDSAVVIAIYADAAQSDSAVLGLAGDSGTTVVTHDSVHAHVRRARAPWKEIVAGVENYDPVRRMDMRARTSIAPPRTAAGAPELSTLILFAGDTSASAGSLEDALAHALTADDLAGTRKLGLYWEMYGANAANATGSERVARPGSDSTLDDSAKVAPVAVPDTSSSAIATPTATPTAPADVSVTVTRIDGGVLKWLAQALRISPRDSRLAVQWHEAQLGSGVTARSVVLDLAQLPAGTYRIELGVGADAGSRTITSRDIRLR